MKALVVFDSFFGNTEKVARAIGDALSAKASVEAVRIDAVSQEMLAGVQLLVVGSPTRAFRASPATTGWLNALAPDSLRGVKVAAFDTRITPEDTGSRVYSTMARALGYAAGPIAKQLVARGGELALPPEGFRVNDKEGPLKEGELERATAWALRLVAT